MATLISDIPFKLSFIHLSSLNLWPLLRSLELLLSPLENNIPTHRHKILTPWVPQGSQKIGEKIIWKSGQLPPVPDISENWQRGVNSIIFNTAPLCSKDLGENL